MIIEYYDPTCPSESELHTRIYELQVVLGSVIRSLEVADRALTGLPGEVLPFLAKVHVQQALSVAKLSQQGDAE